MCVCACCVLLSVKASSTNCFLLSPFFSSASNIDFLCPSQDLPYFFKAVTLVPNILNRYLFFFPLSLSPFPSCSLLEGVDPIKYQANPQSTKTTQASTCQNRQRESITGRKRWRRRRPLTVQRGGGLHPMLQVTANLHELSEWEVAITKYCEYRHKMCLRGQCTLTVPYP